MATEKEQSTATPPTSKEEGRSSPGDRFDPGEPGRHHGEAPAVWSARIGAHPAGDATHESVFASGKDDGGIRSYPPTISFRKRDGEYCLDTNGRGLARGWEVSHPCRETPRAVAE